MDLKIENYAKTLENYLLSELSFAVVLVVIILICSLVSIKFFPKKTKYFFILTGLFIAHYAFLLIPGFIDVNERSINIVEDVGYKRNLHSRDYFSFTKRGEAEIFFYLPGERGKRGYLIDEDTDKYPFEEGSGIIVYGEHSKYVIDFVFDE